MPDDTRSLTLDGADYRSDPVVDVAPRPAPVAPGRVLVRGLTPDGLPVVVRVAPEEAARLSADAEARRRRARDRVRLAGMFDDPTADPAEREALRRALSKPLPEPRRRPASS